MDIRREEAHAYSSCLRADPGALNLRTSYAVSVVPNAAQSVDGVIAVKSSRYARKDCTPFNEPYGFYGNIFCQPTEQEYLRNIGSRWQQQDPRSRAYKYYKPRR